MAVIKVSMDKRILNEFGSKILNEERMDRVFATRKPNDQLDHAQVAFDCECDNDQCRETIQMSTEEYQRVHLKSRNFVVIPSHVQLDLEKVVESFSEYTLVGKFFPHQPSN